MIPREFLHVAAGNLWRLKLRTGLTISGVIIGVGAMVTFLSYAAGIQASVSEQFHSLGLLHTLHVMPASAAEGDGGDRSPAGATADSTSTVPLDDAALARIAMFPGVTFVYPQDTFDAQLVWRDRSRSITAQVLPSSYAQKRRVGEMIAGRFFAADSSAEVVLGRRLVERLGGEPATILGDTLRLRVASRFQLGREILGSTLRSFNLPPGIAIQADRVLEMFVDRRGSGVLDLTVCGVAEIESGFGFELQPVLLPPGPARQVDRLSFSDPIELLSELRAPAGSYALAVITLDRHADAAAIADSIAAMGLRTFSFAHRLAEMRRMFLLFDLIVGLIGAIALVVAALGIVNTMIMSISERTREIGILKSLGAEDRQIRGLFLVEAGLIGLIGSLLGLGLGWSVSRVLSWIAKRIMIDQGAPALEFFQLPVLLALGALVFGTAVSLLAGLYPAARAARTDPVQALRHD